jgi:hypothetical protein
MGNRITITAITFDLTDLKEMETLSSIGFDL